MLGEGQGGRSIVGLVAHPIGELTRIAVATSKHLRYPALRFQVLLVQLALSFRFTQLLGE